MKPGPPPKPKKLRVVEGNPSGRKIPNQPEPDPTPPGCPQWLPAEGKRMWKKLAPELERLGLLTKVDGEAFAAACASWANAVEAGKAIKRDGVLMMATVYDRHNEPVGERLTRHPGFQILRDSLHQFRSFAAEFGLTPSSRMRLNFPNEEEQDLEALLG